MTLLEPKTLRILCFGDSLTSGYSHFGMQSYPYADHLRAPVAKILPDTNVIIDVAGVPGDRVMAPGQYIRRIEAKCAKAAAVPYDWIIIMGGTNDLGWGRAPKDIYEALSTVWKVALDTGAKVLALNVIEASAPVRELIEKRNDLNKRIKHHVEDRWFHFDICSAVPYFSLDEAAQEEIWDDGVHLTEAGYKKMGDAIAARMVELISEDMTREVTG